MQRKESSPYAGLLIVAVLVGWMVVASLSRPTDDGPRIPFSRVAELVQAGKVRKLTLAGDTVHGVKTDGTRFISRKEPSTSLIATLRTLGVSQERLSRTAIQVQPPPADPTWLILLLSYGGFFLVMLFLFYPPTDTEHRGSSLEGDSAQPFIHNSIRRYHSGRTYPRVSFADVAGLEGAKTELREVVEFLQHPWRFTQLGAHVPKGILLVGPPGCGKTLLAKAVAGEANVPFFTISGSEFVEIFAGVGAARVRSLFAKARRSAPCIIFIDEIDAVGRRRERGADTGTSEWEQTLNQLLVEMDGFEQDETVIVLAATNRPDILDPALLRPGRFDRQVVVELPDRFGRQAILEVCTQYKPLASDVDLEVIARQTPGFSGADLENVVNEAAILAVRHNQRAIGMAELQEAVEKVRVGPERKSRLLSSAEREVVAYHEAGHALVRALLPGCDPVHRVSIIPRGTHLAHTVSLPETDRRLHTRTELNDELVGLLAGRAAEELVFDSVSTQAADDLREAAQLARRMVTQFGMSRRLGPLVYGQRHELVFLGRNIGEQRNYSQATAQVIDAEVAHLIIRAHQRARTLLANHQPALAQLAQKLLEKEVVEGEELADLVAESAGFHTHPGRTGAPSNLSQRSGNDDSQDTVSR